MKVPRGATHALTHTALTDLTVAAALVRKAYSKRRRLRLRVETGESEDVETHSRPHCDGTGLCRAQRYGVVVHTRENSVKYGHNFNQAPDGPRK